MEHRDLTAAQRAGKNLKTLIKSHGYTQDKFACEVMFVDPVTVRRWIASGIKDVNTIEQICEIFNIELMDLLK